MGLAINYTLMTPIYLQWVVRFWSELEMYFNALQRVLHYSKLRQENQLNQQVRIGTKLKKSQSIQMSRYPNSQRCCHQRSVPGGR